MTIIVIIANSGAARLLKDFLHVDIGHSIIFIVRSRYRDNALASNKKQYNVIANK